MTPTPEANEAYENKSLTEVVSALPEALYAESTPEEVKAMGSVLSRISKAFSLPELRPETEAPTQYAHIARAVGGLQLWVLPMLAKYNAAHPNAPMRTFPIDQKCGEKTKELLLFTLNSSETPPPINRNEYAARARNAKAARERVERVAEAPMIAVEKVYSNNETRYEIDELLGTLSAAEESGNKGPLAYNPDDRGGKSYGTYQMHSKTDHLPAFARRVGITGTPGTDAFLRSWRAAVNRLGPKKFQAAEHQHIKETHFDVQAQEIRRRTGLDVTARSKAVQDMVWSTAVQHGPWTKIISDIVKKNGGKNISDEVLLAQVYKARAKKEPTLKKRYNREFLAAMEMLNDTEKAA